MQPREVHVIPDDRTTWRVYEPGTGKPVSEHTNATDAEVAALALADQHAERVVIHDRYNRTHEAVPSAAAAAARQRLERARRLARVLERAQDLPLHPR
jgi:hypothetical protein